MESETRNGLQEQDQDERLLAIEEIAMLCPSSNCKKCKSWFFRTYLQGNIDNLIS